MKISLSVGTLGCVFLGNQVPSFLSGGTASQAHPHGVGKPLRQEVAGDGVLILPLDDCHGLILWWAWQRWLGQGEGLGQ